MTLREILIPKSRDLVSHNPGISGLKNGPGSLDPGIRDPGIAVPKAIISRGRQEASMWLKDYSLKDVYNIDETGQFYRMMPYRSLRTADKTKARGRLPIRCN